MSATGSRRARGLTARAIAAALVVSAATGLLSACDATTSTARNPDAVHLTATPNPSGASQDAGGGATVIAIRVSADGVDPDGTRVAVALDRPVVLQIEADHEGEFHIHSSPEQQITFPAGTSSIELRFDRPGIVDVEDHALDALVVQLEVS